MLRLDFEVVLRGRRVIGDLEVVRLLTLLDCNGVLPRVSDAHVAKLTASYYL